MTPPTLGLKHKGMRVSAQGLLGRIAMLPTKPDKGQRYMVSCLLEHLHEMAKAFYEGDTEAVDKFLQVYCFDAKRPNAPESAQ